jgi:alpha-beta hydrolase superfamily lysophospholipase
LAQRFAKHGYEFTGIDMRGHGHSDGLRGYYESAQITIDDQI